MRQHLNERQNEIWATLQREGEVKIGELKERFAVTDMTIRRDLEKLEALGVARRIFGGAIPVTSDVSLRERDTVRLDEKARIGQAAAGLVGFDQAIFIDGGTTTLQVARHIRPDLSVTVITNALNVAAVLTERDIHTIVVGGLVLEKTGSMVGPMAVDALQTMAFDHVFLGTTGMTVEHGFSNSNALEAELKRHVMRRANHVHIVADASKFGERSLHSFASLSEAHTLVTDAEPSAVYLAAAAEAGLTVIVAEE